MRHTVKGGAATEGGYTRSMLRLVIFLLWLPGTLAAQQADSAAEAATPGTYSRFEGVEYYCRDGDGNRVELGQVICIRASCQSWMARCEMSANNNLAMWRKLQDGCPGASLRGRIERLQPALDALAVHTQI